MVEQWRPLKENPDCYEISNYGGLRSIGCRLKWGGIYLRQKPLKMTFGVSKNGYCTVAIIINGKRKMMLVHRLVASNFIGTLFEGAEVNHLDGNKQNNNVDNLEICTHGENVRHAYRVLHVRNSSQGKRGIHNPRGKAVACFDDAGNKILEFEGLRLAAEHFNSTHGHISVAIKKKRKALCYFWNYIK